MSRLSRLTGDTKGRKYISCFSLGVVLALAHSDAFAQKANPAVKKQLEQLLDTGWPPSVRARTAAAELYEPLEPLAASDCRIEYAYALVQLRQFRHAEAAKLIDRVAAADKQNRSVRRLKIWLAVVLKQYDKAVAELPRLADVLPADEAQGDAELPYLEVAGFLGRICGFLEGPVRKGVDQAALASAIEKTSGKLTTRRRAAFENGRKVVRDQFATMTEEADLTRSTTKESAEKQKNRLLGDLDRKAQELVAQADAEKERLEKLKEQLNYEVDKIDSDDRQIVPQIHQFLAQSAAARRDLRTIDIRVAQLHDLASREKDPDRRQMYLNDAAAWQIQRHERAAAAIAADRQLADLNARHGALVQKRRDIEARWQRESGRSEKLLGSLNRLEKDKKKLEKQPVTGDTRQVMDQKSKAVTLSTYVPMPISLEEEKAKLLESF